MNRDVEQFSAGYFLLNAETVSYAGEEVVMPHDLFSEVVNHVTRPLLRIGDAHYWAKPECSIPGNTVAVPEYVRAEGGDPVLIAKDDTASRLMKVGEQERPA